ncbi:MAG: amidophosphoribosyltransferase [Oscillospiraceae bacterium]|jgi:amidophosphoribosyltransferase|nr:amidophosphoribosyltransferase [Oscillospiraceae bacterium]
MPFIDELTDKLHEECGVFGIYSYDSEIDIANASVFGLYALQHRGQESCGIYVSDRGVPVGVKRVGLVHEVFTKEALEILGTGQMAVGHVRYGTTGCNTSRNAQPMHVNHAKGSLVVAHNGNLTNAGELRDQFEMDGCIFHSTNDTEVIAYAITRQRIKSSTIEEAVCKAVDSLVGAYSLVMMSSTKMICCRDPLGFRPLVIGKIGEHGENVPPHAYVVCSETCALDSVGATFVRDVLPGEIVVIDKDGLRSIPHNVDKGRPKHMCIFEYIYFARPDSFMDGNSVHISRENAGKMLAMRYPVQADVVIGIPDSGMDAAVGYAKQSGIPYAIGMIKNRYIARTFIQPNQSDRTNGVRIKLNPVKHVVNGKRVIFVDDSIVRGTTVSRIVKILREAGATEVHAMSAAPPFRYPCYFGTDVDTRENLIANQHETYADIARAIGADSVGYLAVEDLPMLVRPKQGICHACFTGDYNVPIPEEPLLKSKFENKLPFDENQLRLEEK